MGTRETFDASSGSLTEAFDALCAVLRTQGRNSLEFARARVRYEVAHLFWRSHQLQLRADAESSRFKSPGAGRQLLVVHEREPVAESVLQLAKLQGFDAASSRCSDLADSLSALRPQLVFLDDEPHRASKIEAIDLCRRQARRCRIVLLSAVRSPMHSWPGVDAVMTRPASVQAILERCCELVPMAGLA
ncbi:hypothetical protein GCT13_36810 [Paraburkholderia sp. CNPSo 3157]|uniref:Response regulatory domain-containing protein n=1 Tax=Paraburkholderia franconis TaxID=2654983 RepID=A0A7X1TKC1_9BURK|nr:hypothetical protein [Paraburkholderia franconis]MPW22244.1 hypothetical protein [Paraburkholderia franconis]